MGVECGHRGRRVNQVRRNQNELFPERILARCPSERMAPWTCHQIQSQSAETRERCHQGGRRSYLQRNVGFAQFANGSLGLFHGQKRHAVGATNRIALLARKQHPQYDRNGC